MNTFSVTTTKTISAELICDQIVTAIEGGSNSWLNKFSRMSTENEPVERPWYADPKVWEGDFKIKCVAEEDEDPIVLTPELINKGLAYLAENYPDRIEEIISENGDAETADVFLQACLFQDIVYG